MDTENQEQITLNFNENEQNAGEEQYTEQNSTQENVEQQEAGETTQDNINTENRDDNREQNDITEQDDNKQQPDESDDEEYDVNEVYNFLKDSGIAPPLPEGQEVKFNSLQDVANYIYQSQQQLVKQRIQEELNNYPESYRDLFEYVKKGGKVEEFVENYRNSYEDIKYSDLSNNLSLQKKVMRDYYKNTTQWTDDIIDKHLSKFSDDEIADMSRSSLEQLKQIEYNKKQQLKQQQEEQQKQIEQYRNQLIQSYKEQLNKLNRIGDIDVDINTKKTIEENLFADKTYYKIMNEFDKYRLQLAVLDSYGVLDDLNKLSDLLNRKNSGKKYSFKKKKTTKQNKNDDTFDIELISPQKSDNQGVDLFYKF